MTGLFCGPFLAACLMAAGPAYAAGTGAMAVAASNGTLTFEVARRSMRRLSRVHFDKADRNGDGLIDRRELPALEGIYRTMYVER